jgi:hypothetical protein
MNEGRNFCKITKITMAGSELRTSMCKYSAFNRGGNRERSVKPEHLSRIAGVTADSGMSQQR